VHEDPDIQKGIISLRLPGGSGIALEHGMKKVTSVVKVLKIVAQASGKGGANSVLTMIPVVGTRIGMIKAAWRLLRMGIRWAGWWKRRLMPQTGEPVKQKKLARVRTPRTPATVRERNANRQRPQRRKRGALA
jgi:hypothetical protein